MRERTMSAYEPVFPVPVWARARMSFPASPAGTVSVWMGVGSVHPMSEIPFNNLSFKPRPLKPVMSFIPKY